MNARYFTLAEARAALPKVKELMETIQVERREILRLRPAAWPAIRKASTNGGSRAAGQIALHIRTLEDAVKTILGMGIFIKDLDEGVVDFLGKRNDREVFLCWRYGEDDLAHWHELNAGFAGRQPLDAWVD